MNRKLFSSILLSFCCLSLITVGFAGWASMSKSNIGVNGEINIGGFNEINCLRADGEPTSFVIGKNGYGQNEQFVNECGVSFNFVIDNAYFDMNSINSVMLETTLVMGNLKSSLEPYFVGVSVGSNNYAKQNPFPEYVPSKRNQTYIEQVETPLDKNSVETRFSIKYNFKGAFYDKLHGDMTLSLNVRQVGTK